MREIPLTRGMVAIVDAADYDKLAAYKWYAYPGKTTFYAIRGVRRGAGKPSETIRMHAEVVGATPWQMVDHADGDGLNNRRSNLRLCTDSQNSRNRFAVLGKRDCASKGVTKDFHRFRACIYPFGGKRIHLGTFATEREAADAYDDAAIKHYGAFAKTNAMIRQSLGVTPLYAPEDPT